MDLSDCWDCSFSLSATAGSCLVSWLAIFIGRLVFVRAHPIVRVIGRMVAVLGVLFGLTVLFSILSAGIAWPLERAADPFDFILRARRLDDLAALVWVVVAILCWIVGSRRPRGTGITEGSIRIEANKRPPDG